MTVPNIENRNRGGLARRWLAALPVLAASLAMAAGGGTAQADWIREIRTEALYHSNVSRSNRDADVRDDFAFGASAHVGKYTHLASHLRFTLTLDVESQLWAQYNDFNNVSVGGTASLRYRFGLGAEAPFLKVEGSARAAEFGQELQDGARYQGSVVIGKRFAERVELQLGYVFDRADARDSLFEQEGHSFLARVAVDVWSGTQVSVEYSARRGEVVSYAVPPRPDLVALANKRLEVLTFGEPYVAYNLDATTQRVALGLGHALTSHLGVSLRYEWQYTTRTQIDYTSHVLLAAFQISF